MRHDYDSQHVNGAFAAVAVMGFLMFVAGAVALTVAVFSL